MQKLRPLIVAVVVGLLAVGLTAIIAGCGKKGESSSNVIAEVNGKAITNAELTKVLKEDDARNGGRALDDLIVRQLMRQEAEKKGIKVGKEEITKRIDSMRDDVMAGTGKNMEDWVKESGQSMDDLQEYISFQILQGKLVLTDADKKKFFEDNKKLLETLPQNSESVIYRRIVVATKPEAEALRAQFTAKDSKADFAKVAEEKSLDPMTRGRGGMAGWAVKGKLTPPDPALEKVLFALKPGEVSEPLPFKTQVPQGVNMTPPERWQVVKVEKHIAPHQITLADNEYQIEQAMVRDPKFQPQLQQFLMNLQMKADIKIVDPVYKPFGDMLDQLKKQQEQMQAAPGMMPGAAPGGAAPGAQGGAPNVNPDGSVRRTPAGQAPARTK